MGVDARGQSTMTLPDAERQVEPETFDSTTGR
jgi:hypothetical protein